MRGNQLVQGELAASVMDIYPDRVDVIIGIKPEDGETNGLEDRSRTLDGIRGDAEFRLAYGSYDLILCHANSHVAHRFKRNQASRIIEERYVHWGHLAADNEILDDKMSSMLVFK
ncbi:hypothetical protein [Rhodopirellula europaea]|nr:hypothetical protein [Rhodopirellula europaea]